MRKTVAIIGYLCICQAANAQIDDPEQRMRWFNLQRLAIEASELETCQIINLKDERFERARQRTADDLGKAVEAYIATYPGGRAKAETVEAYHYRVWHVAIRVGIERARGVRQLPQNACEILLAGRI